MPISPHPVRRLSRLLLLGAGFSVVLLQAKVDFNREIRPLLSENCFKCHGFDEKERKSGLRLDLRAEAIKPSKSGAQAIVPGKPDGSELFKRLITQDADDQMPPVKSGKKLTAAQIKTVKQWITEGAEYQAHWSFVPPSRPELPEVKRANWSRNEIDRFILARLEKDKLRPLPEANKETLIRRLSLDLTGLPPTLAEIEAFLADRGANAYEHLVDRLLKSPRYGERMAVDWLDAARFADTHGYHLDSGRDLTAWRDWVIESFNNNQPFDAFTIEQLAGDILAERLTAETGRKEAGGLTVAELESKKTKMRVASGFNRNHMINYEGGAIAEEYQHAYLVDRVNTTSTVWLGLTFACAQCHDHKYDPITQKEYYQFYAFFNNVPESGLDGYSGNAKPFLQLPTAAESKRLNQIDEGLRQTQTAFNEAEAALPPLQSLWEKAWREKSPATPTDREKPILELLTKPSESLNEAQRKQLSTFFRETAAPESFRTLSKALSDLRKERDGLNKAIQTTMVMGELATPRDTPMHLRGLYDQLGEKVSPGVPASLPSIKTQGRADRLNLAEWLVSPDQPLTARVAVNRFWQQYFGTGFVKSAEDFGSQGEQSSHPELLDWLATEFMQSGWNVKALNKKIVMSATYRQSSRMSSKTHERDPENRLLARGPRFRLKAEFVRDQALAVGGLLGETIGGRSVRPYQPGDLWRELSQRADSANFSAQFFVQSTGSDLYRRSMYTFWKRTSPPPQMSTFDAPDREVCTVRRPRTNTPLQALVLLNDPTYLEAARHLAERVLGAVQKEDERLALIFRMATGRKAEKKELSILQAVFIDQLARYKASEPAAVALLKAGDSAYSTRWTPAELAAWTLVASTVLNLDETVTKG